jgi:hypothetical protein
MMNVTETAKPPTIEVHSAKLFEEFSNQLLESADPSRMQWNKAAGIVVIRADNVTLVYKVQPTMLGRLSQTGVLIAELRA